MLDIITETKNLTTVERGIIVHGCNCQGVMGSGVAKALRDKWPEIYSPYREVCYQAKLRGETLLLLGRIIPVRVKDGLFVYNGLTQQYYGKDNRVYASVFAVKSVLDETVSEAYARGIKDVWMPKIGCGLGGLDEEKDLDPILESLLEKWCNPYEGEVVLHICDL